MGQAAEEELRKLQAVQVDVPQNWLQNQKGGRVYSISYMPFYNMDVNTIITLCNVPITPTNELLFNNATEQKAYFDSHVVKRVTTAKYQPRSGTMRVKGYVEALQLANYGYYVNTYEGRSQIYYFWVVAKDYVAKEVTELTIQIDVIQTWMYTAKHNPCFVERMHTDTDDIYTHTYPEDFELGDYVCYHKQGIADMVGDLGYIVAESVLVGGETYNKVYSGFSLIYFGTASALKEYIDAYADQGKSDGIGFIFCFPKKILQKYYGISPSSNKIKIPDGIIESVQIQFEDKKATSIYDGDITKEEYTPKNKKLLGYPYKFLQIVAPNGSNTILKRELMKDIATGMSVFNLSWTMGQNPTFSLIPVEYNGKNLSLEDSIECNGYPLCSWNNDNYANWYAQNNSSMRAARYANYQNYNTAKSIAMNNASTSATNAEESKTNAYINTGLNAAGNLLSLNWGGLAGNAADALINIPMQARQATRNINNDLSNALLQANTNYQNTVGALNASVRDAQVMPNTCKGDTTASGLDVMRGTNTFYFECINIRPEYAKIIDDYWTVYGYKVMRVVRDPIKFIRSRKNWNYIKTINDTCYGNLPQADRDEISRIFNNGITFWHNEQTFMNYVEDNPVINPVEDGYLHGSGERPIVPTALKMQKVNDTQDLGENVIDRSISYVSSHLADQEE